MNIAPITTDVLTNRPDKSTKIESAAKEFEAMMISQMLKAAHAAGGSSWSGDEDDANSTLTDMGEQQLAQALASGGGLGLAKMVVAGLSGHADQSQSTKLDRTAGAK